MSDRFPPLRRKDRAATEEWIVDYVTGAPFAVVAVAERDQPYLTTVTFVYLRDRNAIYFHTSSAGHLNAQVTLQIGRSATFTCLEMGRLLPAKTARNLSVEYASVVAYGRLIVVDDLSERRAAMESLNAKYFPHLVPGDSIREVTDSELLEISVYRLSIEHWSGKRKTAPPDFPGAFTFGQHPTALDSD
jgi:nitroimidazol reductase NimA-like FMN-containing flavoprotein (pyridoxamine 5'-phosphate oxidase superfamily)